MRCTNKFTCVAQCLAALMLRQAGLLTEHDYTLLTNAGIVSPTSDSGEHYVQDAAKCFRHKMKNFAKPIHGDEPLMVEAGNITASGYHREWKEQLCREYQNILRRHVEHTYNEDSLHKRDGGNGVEPSVDASTEELRQAFLSSEQLRKSCVYVRSLVDAYNRRCNSFYDLMKAIKHKSKEILGTIKNPQDVNLEKLDPTSITMLNRLRKELDDCTVLSSIKWFGGIVVNRIFGTAAAPKKVDDDLISAVKNYCNNSLVYVAQIPEVVSRSLIVNAAFGISDHEIRKITSGETTVRGALKDRLDDPFENLHLIYPEMNYQAWGYFWKTVQKQLTVELEALKKHVDEVDRCRSGDKPESYVKYLVRRIDFVLKSRRNAHRGHELSHEKIDEIIEGSVAAIAREVSSLSFEEIDKLIANATEVDDEGMTGSFEMLNIDDEADSNFELISAADTDASSASGISRKRTHDNVIAEEDSAYAGEHSHHYCADQATQSGESQSEIERKLEHAREMLAKYQARVASLEASSQAAKKMKE
ncbi:hypothetical protein PAPHI01_0639 [Pancytospora philotis]|nr:hypothetical protein PAPHI01_0639 [Pancytospora philotis]